jgi:NAD(P)H dehydrogenase (quinone)
LRCAKPHGGKTYLLYGPVEHTYPEMAAIISKIIGKEVKYEQLSVDAFADLLGMGSNTYFKAHCTAVAEDYATGIFAGTNDLILKIGGRSPMTVEHFVEKHRAAFV